ncbi:TIGR03086 family metal-binding protein [Modestobacter versicolor]|uniref:TIGR03086 family metal-binding protein n=1 Tax=Modestobacter versicolor TaxID=429133 RepID=UPI0034DE5CFB
MTMTTPLDLGPAVATTNRVVAGVRDDQLTGPTPCADTTVAALLDHVHGLALGLRQAALKQPTGEPVAAAETLPTDWRTRIPPELDDLAAAWRDPAAWAGESEAGGVPLPASWAGRVALNEVLVHGWDLAVATGQLYEPDPAAVQACLDYAYEFAAAAPEGRDTIYGPVVPVPDDAPVFDRLLGLTGRDPSWTPPN